MSDEIASALPPEDWERIARLRPAQLSGESNDLWRMALTMLQAEGPAACIAVVMALLPDDDPRKITRADTDLLESCCGGDVGISDDNWKGCLRVIEKLRAFLPTE